MQKRLVSHSRARNMKKRALLKLKVLHGQWISWLVEFNITMKTYHRLLLLRGDCWALNLANHTATKPHDIASGQRMFDIDDTLTRTSKQTHQCN